METASEFEKDVRVEPVNYKKSQLKFVYIIPLCIHLRNLPIMYVRVLHDKCDFLHLQALLHVLQILLLLLGVITHLGLQFDHPQRWGVHHATLDKVYEIAHLIKLLEVRFSNPDHRQLASHVGSKQRLVRVRTILTDMR